MTNRKIMNKIYKPFLIILIMVGFTFQSKAQVEFKLNPPAALFVFLQTGIEFPIGSDFGIEAEIIAGEGIGAVLMHGKYYFNPDYGADKIYIGIFAGGLGGDGDLAAGFGFEAGYKWVGKRNILMEIGGGVGRASIDDFGIFPYLRLMVGYRFDKKD